MESKKGTEKGEKEGNGKAVLECWGAGVLGAGCWGLGAGWKAKRELRKEKKKGTGKLC